MGWTGLPWVGLHRTVLLPNEAPMLLQTIASEMVASDEVDKLSESCIAHASVFPLSLLSEGFLATISCCVWSCTYAMRHFWCFTG